MQGRNPALGRRTKALQLKEEPAMYQTNPTEIFRERQLALLREAEDRASPEG